jgi:hypothetical protein
VWVLVVEASWHRRHHLVADGFIRLQFNVVVWFMLTSENKCLHLNL